MAWEKRPNPSSLDLEEAPREEELYHRCFLSRPPRSPRVRTRFTGREAPEADDLAKDEAARLRGIDSRVNSHRP